LRQRLRIIAGLIILAFAAYLVVVTAWNSSALLSGGFFAIRARPAFHLIPLAVVVLCLELCCFWLLSRRRRLSIIATSHNGSRAVRAGRNLFAIVQVLLPGYQSEAPKHLTV